LFPNPFDTKLNLVFEIAVDEKADRVEVYDAVGTLVKVIQISHLGSGRQQIIIEGSNNSNGLYLVRFVSNKRSQVAKVIGKL